MYLRTLFIGFKTLSFVKTIALFMSWLKLPTEIFGFVYGKPGKTAINKQ